jgi:drug/metabolite transporter (DMT)-like permease
VSEGWKPRCDGDSEVTLSGHASLPGGEKRPVVGSGEELCRPLAFEPAVQHGRAKDDRGRRGNLPGARSRLSRWFSTLSTHTHLVAGVTITIVSAVLYNVGFVLEKHALGSLPPVHAKRLVHLLTSVLSSPLWVAGFVSMLGGLAGQVLALSLVSISVVQPVFVSGLVVLLVLSHVLLKERLVRREWAAMCAVGLSLLAISLSLDSSSDHAGANGAFSSLVLAAIPTMLVAGWLFLSADRVQLRRSGRLQFRAPMFGVSTGLMYGVTALATKAVAAQVEKFGLIASIPHVLDSAYIYTLAFTSAIGLLLFQTALQRCQASVVVPVSNVVSSTYLVAVGTFIFGEHLPDSEWKLALRIVGFCGVLASVLVLANAKSFSEAEIPLVDEPISLLDERRLSGRPVE